MTFIARVNVDVESIMLYRAALAGPCTTDITCCVRAVNLAFATGRFILSCVNLLRGWLMPRTKPYRPEKLCMRGTADMFAFWMFTSKLSLL